GQRLQNKMLAVAIDDHTRQSVALAPNHATKSIVDLSPFAILSRLRDPAFEEVEIEILFSPRKSARHDLRFGIVNRAADQMITAILKRYDVAIRRLSENLQHFAGEDPIVPV